MKTLNILLTFIIAGCGSAFPVRTSEKIVVDRVYPGPCRITDTGKNDTTSFEYINNSGQKRVSKMLGRGFTSEFSYDDSGNILSKKIRNRKVDATFYYTWDSFNNLQQVKYVPENQPDKILRYNIDLKYSGTAGASHVVAGFNYDKDGFPNAHFFETRFNIALLSHGADISVQKKITYNAQNQPALIVVSNITETDIACEPTVAKIEYNETGLIKRIEQTNSIYPDHPDIKEFEYDAHSRPILIIDSTWGGDKYFKKNIAHVYDAAGNTLSVREFEEDTGNTIRFEEYDYSCWTDNL